MNELEDKEQVYQTAINNVEKEINLRQQALDSHRKKAMENAQSSSEAKLTLGEQLSYAPHRQSIFPFLNAIQNYINW